MQGNSTNALAYLVGTLVDLYVVAVLLRLLLQWVRADFYNPVCQFLVKVTNPLLVPLRRVIPSVGRLDTAAVVLMLALEMLGAALIGLIVSSVPGIDRLAIYAVLKLLSTLLSTYFFLIIAEVILSWVGGRIRHPVIPLVYQLTEPVLRPFRRIIPPIAGIDLSPLFALIALRFLMLLLR
ncbi:MAG: YggT family protein [Lysobacterales bacterium]|jgi:YggT family protein